VIPVADAQFRWDPRPHQCIVEQQRISVRALLVIVTSADLCLESR